MITEIVVLGGGYTGVWAARAAAGAGARVRLVAADPDHSFHGWTAELITGHVRPERARVPLADLADPAHRCRVLHPSGYIGNGFEVEGMIVWGFTGGIISGLLDRLGWSQPWDETRLVPLPEEAPGL